MAEWLGNGLQNQAQQFDSAWHLYLVVISFSVINYVVSMRGPHVSGDNLFFLCPAIEVCCSSLGRLIFINELPELAVDLMYRKSHYRIE